MRTTVLSLLLGVFLLINTQCVARRIYSVQPKGDDISNNLDLEAVASIFGAASNLEDFERKLNDPDYQISNLDLNNDGAVDFLRVIESNESNVHLIVIQAVLDRDVFQDIATIVVEKTNYRNANVQIIGDPYLYGPNYVIEPYFNHPPTLFSFFWGNSYYRWSSPYYWGYYPNYYRGRTPYSMNRYRSRIHSHINHDYRYNRAERIRYDHYEQMHNSVRRNDYGERHPETNYQNRRQIQSNERNRERAPQTAPSLQRGSERRSPSTTEGTGRGTTAPSQSNSRSTTPSVRSTERPAVTAPSNQMNRGSRTIAPATENSRRSSESQPARTPDSRSGSGGSNRR